MTVLETSGGRLSRRAPKPRVLLVDDDALIAYAATGDLHDEGFDVVVCFNGQEGLDTALAAPFDLVITDLMMPELSGLEMIAQLRAAGATMPIVLATAVASTSLPTAATGGFDRLLAKPYQAMEMRALARYLVALNAQSAPDVAAGG